MALNGWCQLKAWTQLTDKKQQNLAWITLRESEVSKTTYFSPFLAYDIIIKLMKSLESITFMKPHDKKHYLENQSEDSSMGYVRKGK